MALSLKMMPSSSGGGVNDGDALSRLVQFNEHYQRNAGGPSSSAIGGVSGNNGVVVSDTLAAATNALITLTSQPSSTSFSVSEQSIDSSSSVAASSMINPMLLDPIMVYGANTSSSRHSGGDGETSGKGASDSDTLFSAYRYHHASQQQPPQPQSHHSTMMMAQMMPLMMSNAPSSTAAATHSSNVANGFLPPAWLPSHAQPATWPNLHVNGAVTVSTSSSSQPLADGAPGSSFVGAALQHAQLAATGVFGGTSVGLPSVMNGGGEASSASVYDHSYLQASPFGSFAAASFTVPSHNFQAASNGRASNNNNSIATTTGTTTAVGGDTNGGNVENNKADSSSLLNNNNNGFLAVPSTNGCCTSTAADSSVGAPFGGGFDSLAAAAAAAAAAFGGAASTAFSCLNSFPTVPQSGGAQPPPHFFHDPSTSTSSSFGYNGGSGGGGGNTDSDGGFAAAVTKSAREFKANVVAAAAASNIFNTVSLNFGSVATSADPTTTGVQQPKTFDLSMFTSAPLDFVASSLSVEKFNERMGGLSSTVTRTTNGLLTASAPMNGASTSSALRKRVNSNAVSAARNVADGREDVAAESRCTTTTADRSAGSATNNNNIQSIVLHSSCECPNCQENRRRGISLDKKNEKHNCHIPGCHKVYGKSSHLKAHLRWHCVERPCKKRKMDSLA